MYVNRIYAVAPPVGRTNPPQNPGFYRARAENSNFLAQFLRKN